MRSSVLVSIILLLLRSKEKFHVQVTQYQEDRWEDWEEKQRRNTRDGKKK